MAPHATARPPVLFHAVHRPRCSGDRRQARLVVSLLGGVLAVVGVGFVAAGAWPVVGFFGLEVGLVYAALRIHRGAGCASETLRLTPDELSVIRVDRRGRRQCWSFQPHWLRVTARERGPSAGLVELSSHGRSVLVGGFLGAAERARLAADLTRALAPLTGLGPPPAARRPHRGGRPCRPCRPARV